MNKIILALILTIPSLSQASSLDCMARAIYFESRGGSETDQLAVAHTVQNRVKSKSFPNSICGVVGQRSQFAPNVRSGAIREQKSWSTAKKLASRVLSGASKDFTNNSLYFHTLAVKPKWSRKFRVVHRNRQHIFYKP